MDILGIFVCTSRVLKMKEHLPLEKYEKKKNHAARPVANSSYLVLKIEVMLTVLSYIEREAALKDVAF